MKLIINGSGSSGNQYILESADEILLIEAGIRLRKVTSVLNPNKNVVGILPLHLHQDHAKYAKDYANRFCAPLYSNEDVIKRYGDKENDVIMEEGKTYSIGKFRVTAFPLYHDIPTFGILVFHKEMGTLLYVSDSFALPYMFQNVNHFMFECNYDDDIIENNLREGKIDKKQYERIVTSHMSLFNCIKNLELCHGEKAETITLVHLSARNSDKQMFRDRVAGAFGVPTYIATKGLEIYLNRK